MVENIDWANLHNVVGTIVHLDEEFEKSCQKKAPIFINDISVKTDNDAMNLRDRLTIKYTGDVLDVLEGENPVEQPIEVDYWIRTPKHVDWFMTPIIRVMLEQKCTVSDPGSGTRVSVLSYYCDPMYRLPVGYVPDKRFQRLMDEGIPRGINEFYHHFDKFLDIWFRIQTRRGGYKEFKEPVYDLIQKYRDRIFVKHLAMYSRHVFAIEANDNFESMDKSVISFALDAVYTLTSIEMEIKEPTPKKMQSKAWKVGTQIAESVKSYLRNVFLKKEGMLRKSVCGTPASYNSRCIIAATQKPNHHYSSLTIPWAVAMVLFAQELAGILVREHRWTALEVFQMRSTYAKKVNPFIYDILMKFLKDHREGGKPAVLHRPPTLERGSHQTVCIDGITLDPRILVFFMSNLITRAFNADFDGDELTLSILHDHKMADLFERLKPHYGALDLNSPLTLSGNLVIPKAHAVKLERFLGRHRQV